MKNSIKNSLVASLSVLFCAFSTQQNLHAQVDTVPLQPFRAHIQDFDLYKGRVHAPLRYVGDNNFSLVGTRVRSPGRIQEVVAVSWIGAFDNTNAYDHMSLFDANTVVGVVIVKDNDDTNLTDKIDDSMKDVRKMAHLGTPNPNQDQLPIEFFIQNSGPIKVLSANVKTNGLGSYYGYNSQDEAIHAGWYVHIHMILPKPIRLPGTARIMPYIRNSKASNTWIPMSELSRGANPMDLMVFRTARTSTSIWTIDRLLQGQSPEDAAAAYERVSPIGVHVRPISEPSTAYNGTTRKVEVRWPEIAKGLFLQSTPRLLDPIWSDVFQTPLSASTVQPHIIDPVTNPNGYFRLAEKDL